MSEERRRHTPIHLSEEELLSKLPAQIGKVKLDYQFYPGKDLYSDGEIEDKILSIVKNAAHVEYPSIIEESGSWPILYHLSSLRGNIVDWLPIKSTDKVLEIGSGCGVITEKLAEKAKSVTCVDLSAKRSRINAYRNQDKDNIEIHVGNFSDIEPSLEEDYDFACMIGVFEYGQSYIHTKTPYEDFLKIMMKHVKKEGCIVIAIENKFGLKYWAGCQEDHAGAYFCGLEGYPEGGSARTFTRPGLEKIFKNCGVENYSFYYPYPDYKFPTVIYSDRRLPHQGELTDNIRNFDRDRMVLFNEKYVFDGTIQDGLFDVFSNSYLVMIGGEANTCYVKYSNDRAGEYALRTDIVDTPDGRVVRKIPMNEQAAGHIRGMKQAYELLKDRYEGSGLSINACQITKEGYAQFPYEKGVTLTDHKMHTFPQGRGHLPEGVVFNPVEFKGQIITLSLQCRNPSCQIRIAQVLRFVSVTVIHLLCPVFFPAFFLTLHFPSPPAPNCSSLPVLIWSTGLLPAYRTCTPRRELHPCAALRQIPSNLHLSGLSDYF